MSHMFGESSMEKAVDKQNQEQEKILKQQQQEKSFKDAQLDRERVSALRGRFSGGDDAAASANTPEAGASLYSLITGNN